MIVAGMRIGKYELTKQLGRGGFGVVFVAHDHSLGRECALKFLLPEHTARADLVERFVQEARTAAKIRHLGIVTVFECGVFAGTATAADGTAYIAMELLEGESLAARMTRVGPISELAAIAIARQVAAALGAAHTDGIVHRDLKPDNIFLVPDQAAISGERVKVLDFGIAKLADSTDSAHQTATYAVFGTPRYMSPEQCRSTTNVDARADIYALGCIMFELVCGRAPFGGESGEQLAHHQLTPPPAVRSLQSHISERFEALVTAMLAKQPNDRPPSMDAVIRLLDLASADATDATGVRMPLPIRPVAHVPLPSVPAPSAILERAPQAAPPATAEHAQAASTELDAPPARRWPLVAGGLLAITGIIAGVVIASRSGSTVRVSAPIDAQLAPISAEAVALERRCRELIASETWAKLAECADGLRKLGDQPHADELVAIATRELTAMGVARKMTEAIARFATVDEIIQVYNELDVNSKYQPAVRDEIYVYYHGEASQLANHHQCEALDNLRDAAQKLPTRAYEDVLRTTCYPWGDISKLDCSLDPPATAHAALAKGEFAPALRTYAEFIACRDNRAQPIAAGTFIEAVRAACHLRLSMMARLYFARIPDDQRAEVVGECKNTGIRL